jgi:hypothetical protein
VTVTLPWPWWVTTAMALTVTTASLVVAWRVRSAPARAVAALLAVEGVVLAIVAPLVMPDMNSTGAMSLAAMSVRSEVLAGPAPQTSDLPYTFFFTRYEFFGDADSPHSVRYHSDGTPVAASADGSRMTLAGRGGWDPVTQRAAGGGNFAIEDANAKLVARGAWRAKRFLSFEQLPGWWSRDLHPRELGWQGPRGSQTFTGELRLQVEFDGGGAAVLTMWCTMSPEAQTAMRRDWDGFTLVGAGVRFTGWRVNRQRLEGGVMFYGPGASRA